MVPTLSRVAALALPTIRMVWRRRGPDRRTPKVAPCLGMNAEPPRHHRGGQASTCCGHCWSQPFGGSGARLSINTHGLAPARSRPPHARSRPMHPTRNRPRRCGPAPFGCAVASGPREPGRLPVRCVPHLIRGIAWGDAFQVGSSGEAWRSAQRGIGAWILPR